MARKVKAMPTVTTYDYNTWFDGRVWELEPGVDFHTSVAAVRASLYHQATKRGLGIVTRMRDGFLYVQTSPAK